MRTITFILSVLILWHQSTFKTPNGVLVLELVGLIAFYILGQRYLRTWKRRREAKTHLQSSRSKYSPKEIKTWRKYTADATIKSEKESFMDMIQ